MHRGIVFDKIRKAMKARNVKYADLAKALDVSEPTIKRLFQDKDCKLSRLAEICDVLDISLNDIISNDPRPDPSGNYLPMKVERELSENGSLFAVLILIIDGYTLKEIATIYDVEEKSVFLYARDLEKIGLIDIMPNNRVKLTFNGPLTWNPKGPLLRQIKKTNQSFLSWVMNRSECDDTSFSSISRQMRPETAKLIQKDLADLLSRYIELSRQDRLLHSTDDLISYKWASAMSIVKFDEILNVTEHHSLLKKDLVSSLAGK